MDELEPFETKKRAGALGVSSPVAGSTHFYVRLVLIGVVLCSAAWGVNRQYDRRAPVNRAIVEGATQLKADRPILAEVWWRKAIALDPSRPEPYQLLGNLYVSSGRSAQAIPLLERLRQLAPGTPHTLCLLADAYARTDDNARALKTAQQAVLLEPNCPRAHAVLGIELSNQLNHVKAIEELKAAHRLEPGNDRITLTLTQAELNAADLDAAAATAKSVIAHNPRDGRAWYLLGWCLMRQTATPQNKRDAVDALRHAVELDPGNMTAAAQLGRAAASDGDLTHARLYLERAWNSGLKTNDVGNDLASVYARLGDSGRASRIGLELKRKSDLDLKIDSVRRKLGANPRDTDLGLELASLEGEQGDAMAAGGLITAILRSGRRDRRATDLALRIYTAASSRPEAKRLLTSILSKPPAMSESVPDRPDVPTKSRTLAMGASGGASAGGSHP